MTWHTPAEVQPLQTRKQGTFARYTHRVTRMFSGMMLLQSMWPRLGRRRADAALVPLHYDPPLAVEHTPVLARQGGVMVQTRPRMIRFVSFSPPGL